MKDPNPPQKEGRILITGCPRSGTQFTAEFFDAKGCQLEHERAGKDGTVEWRYALTPEPPFKLIVSLSRHPLATIRSLTDLMVAFHTRHQDKPTWYYINKLAKLGNFDYLVDRQLWALAATRWWVAVYEFHQQQDYRQIRVEDLQGEPTHIHPKPDAISIDEDQVWEVVKPIASLRGYTRTGILPQSLNQPFRPSLTK